MVLEKVCVLALSVLDGFQVCKIKKLRMTLAK